MSTKLPRVFRYNSVELEDPGPEHDPVDVRNLYAATYPEILNAAIEGPEAKDGKHVYTFRKAVGTKGNDKFVRIVLANGEEVFLPKPSDPPPAPPLSAMQRCSFAKQVAKFKRAGLSTRIANALAIEGSIRSVRQLRAAVRKSETRFLALPNLGWKSIAEIKRVCGVR